MRFKRALLTLVLTALAVACFAVPQVLIVKLVPEKGSVDGDPNDNLIQYVAQEFDDDGRLSPIAYGLSDPYFRAAVDEGLLKSYPARPDVGSAMQIASKLKAEYVFVVLVIRSRGMLLSKGALYRRGKEIWRDPDKNDPYAELQRHNQEVAERVARKNKMKPPSDAETPETGYRQMAVTNSGSDSENTLRSLARTWITLAGAGPLKSFSAKPRAQVEVHSDPGQKPLVIDTQPPKKVDNKELLNQTMKLLSSHEGAQAVNMLRDAVDAEPLDLERRRALIAALGQTGQPLMAATEARRAALLMPDKPDLRVLAARSFLAAGQADDALIELKEAVSRDPDGIETRMLLGDVALTKLHPNDAVAQYDFVLSKSPTADAYFARAVAKCIGTDSAGAQQDFASAQKAGLANDPVSTLRRYRSAVTLLERSFDDIAPRVRTLFQRARVHPEQSAVVDEAKALATQLDCAGSFFDEMGCPTEHKASHERRSLALKLLNQSLSDIEEFLKSQSDDAISDATITSGEGLKNLKLAKEAYSEELQKG